MANYARGEKKSLGGLKICQRQAYIMRWHLQRSLDVPRHDAQFAMRVMQILWVMSVSRL